jgi:tRNA 2-thiouridine synthesizing protein A
MGVVTMDARGLKCPVPVLRIVAMAPTIPGGDILEVTGNCPTFEKDVRKWCERESKTLLAVNTNGEEVLVRIQF